MTPRCKLCKHWTGISTNMGVCEELTTQLYEDLDFRFAYSAEKSRTNIHTPKFAVCTYFELRPNTHGKQSGQQSVREERSASTQ